MKLLYCQRFEDEAFKSWIAKPTSNLERDALKILKYNCINEDEMLCNWHPEELGPDLALDLADALGYSNVIYNGPDEYMSVENDPEYGNYYITATPTNVECIIAGYRIMGKHRKVARILKECKRRGIEITNWQRGSQLPR